MLVYSRNLSTVLAVMGTLEACMGTAQVLVGIQQLYRVPCMNNYCPNLQSGKTQHQVTQFHIRNWNPQGKCSNPQIIITVMEEIYKVQRRTDNKPIVVHCRY